MIDEDRLKQYSSSMGPQLAEIFLEVYDDLTWLHYKWSEYCVIFAETPEQLAIANEAASSFFFILEKVSREDVFLNIARLTDPREQPQNGKPNLSLRWFEELVLPAYKQRVSDATKEVLDAAQFPRDWRMRYLAHRDLDLSLRRAKPLIPVNRVKIRKALSTMASLVNTVDVLYADTTTIFEPVGSLTGARALLNLLKEGLAAKAARKQGRKYV